MLDKIFEPILAPFRALRDAVFKVKQAPMQLKGEVMRAGGQVQAVKSDVAGYKQDMNQLQKMGKDPRGMMRAEAQQMGQGFGVPVGGQPPMQAPMGQPPAKAKMGLFSKKKKCPSCGQKLHESWTECPYCGWGKGAAAQGGQPAGGGYPQGGGYPPQGGGYPVPSGYPPAGQGGYGAPAPSGGKQRTMALDLNAPAPVGPVSDGMIGWLIPLEGKMAGELFQVKGRSVVGTAPDCSLCVPEASISGHHAEFVPTSTGFRLNDLGSTNGTYVNDKRVQTHDLVDNDNVRLGRINFKYKSMV